MARKRVFPLFRSLRSQMAFLSVLLVVGVSGLLAVNIFRSAHAIRTETRIAIEGSLTLYKNQLEREFRAIGLGLTEYTGYGQELMTIAANKRDSLEWGAAVHRIQSRFTFSKSAYPVDGFCLYIPKTGLFMSSSPVGQELKEEICSSIDTLGSGQNQWNSSSQDAACLYRSIKVYDCYIGTWADAMAVLSRLGGSPANSGYFLSSRDGLLLGAVDATEEVRLPDPAACGPDAYAFVRMNGVRHMMAATPLGFCDLYLLTLIPDATVEASVRNYTVTAAVVIGLTALLLAIFVLGLRRWVIVPIARQTTAIRRLQHGDWDATMEIGGACAELQQVSDAFKDMIAEIQNLKISRYEEQLGWQKTEMEYLKQQIAPHFTINCLNTIYQLSDSGRLELVSAMVLEMSRHIRYALSSGEVVPLDAEIEHVKNYVQLCNIRYNNALLLEMKIEEGIGRCRVVPLLLLNWVENAIKHEVHIGRKLEIHVSARSLSGEAGQRLAFRIWDTGGGFQEDFLERAKDMEQYLKDTRGHIGIGNVYKRAQMLLGDTQFCFCNRPGAGAQTDISIPRMEFGEGEGLV